MRVERIGLATLYLADSRSLELGPGDNSLAMITDPIWPNAPEGMFKMDVPPELLFAQVMARLSSRVKRTTVVLRHDSDPAILNGVLTQPFFKLSMLPYAVPGYIGRRLGGLEVAYTYGTPIKYSEGRRTIPNMAPKAQAGGTNKAHPCARNIDHMRWLVNWYSDPDETVIDPYMGSGTIGVAAVEKGRKFIGVEINPEYFDVACRSLEEAQQQQRMPEMFFVP